MGLIVSAPRLKGVGRLMLCWRSCLLALLLARSAVAQRPAKAMMRMRMMMMMMSVPDETTDGLGDNLSMLLCSCGVRGRTFSHSDGVLVCVAVDSD